MTEIDLGCLLGEAGDVLLSYQNYQQAFTKVTSEVDGKYYRLTDIPRARDALLVRLGILLIVTLEGELALIDNGNPRGFILDVGTPPLKKMWNSRPLSLLDIDDTLHFVNISKIIKQAIPDIDPGFFGDYRIINPSIADIEWIIHQPRVGVSSDWLIIKTSEGLINSSLSNIIAGSYGISQKNDIQKLGNCYSYYENGIRYADSGTDRIKVSSDVVDVMVSYRLTYLLNDRDELWLLNDKIPDGMKKLDFSPVRLLRDNKRRSVYMEDSGGNIYNAYSLIIRPTPVESLNLPVILNGFKRRGTTIKSARLSQ